MGTRFDAVIVGGGPAGSVAGLQLASLGWRVAILEKQSLPRDKVCGDALIPDSLAVLQRVELLEGVRAAGQTARAIRVYAPNGASVDVDGTCICLRRLEFDALLLKAAQAAGARLFEATEGLSYSLFEQGARVTARSGGTARPFETQLVILACGASAKALRGFGLEHRRSPSAIAMRTYYRLDASVPQDLLHIWFERGVLPGYAWIFPVGKNEFNVGAGLFYDHGNVGKVNLRRVFENFSQRCATASKMLRTGTQIDRLAGAPLRTRLQGCCLAAERLLVIGEAIGTTYPFSGEGIGKAMESGLIAAQVGDWALCTGKSSQKDLSRYTQILRSTLLPKYAHYFTAQKWLSHPRVADFVAWRARSSRDARDQLSKILTEEADPTTILSWPGLLKALIS